MSGVSKSRLKIMELDGSPAGFPYALKFSNGTLTDNGDGTMTYAGDGTGTVTDVSVVTANGVSASVSNPSTTPALTFTLGAITPTSVNGLTFATSGITGEGATFALANAATTINVAGASGAVVNLGGGANAAELRFLEPSGSGSNYSAFKAQAQSANVTYTLPAAVGAAGSYLYDSAGNGTLSWNIPTGYSYGASVSGTTDGGTTITLSNSSDDGASALKLIAGNTQGNQPALANLQIGTSANVLGLMIKGTGSTTTGDVGVGRNHLSLWANTASSVVKVLSIANGTSFTETYGIDASGRTLITNVGSANSNEKIFDIEMTGDCRSCVFYVSHSSVTASSAPFMFDFTVSTAATNLGSGTYGSFGYASEMQITRNEQRSSGTTTDTWDMVQFRRINRAQNSGGTLAVEGSVIYISNEISAGSGTVTNTADALKLAQAVTATGYAINVTQNASIFTGTATRASAAGLSYQTVRVAAATLTLTGTTQVTAVTNAAVGIGQLTITDSSSVTVDVASSLYIAAAPVAAGSVTITNAYSIFVDAGNTRLDGNLLLGTSVAGASAANGVLALGNGATAPSDSTDLVQLYAVDISAGNASLGIFTETAVVSETVVSDRTLSVKINGTVYKICLKV